ncbi:MAG: rRNA maturation RNase YbeY [Patescibacteria group bacterium]|nr:rRNA maturation RNase YbeY [Patescibacteria group bacterium]
MIEVNNLTANSIDEDFLKKVSNLVLEGENKKDYYISIAIITPSRIKELNRKYRHKNKVTDVLAFSSSGTLLKKFKINLSKEIEGLGEIVICLNQVRKNAKAYKHNFNEEIYRVLIHGILHLLGYIHEKKGIEESKMRAKENYYLLQVKHKI